MFVGTEVGRAPSRPSQVGGQCMGPSTAAKAVAPPIQGSGKQVSLQSTVSAPCDQDVEEEAKMIETCLEILCEKNPLVVKEGSEVRPNVA